MTTWLLRKTWMKSTNENIIVYLVENKLITSHWKEKTRRQSGKYLLSAL